MITKRLTILNRQSVVLACFALAIGCALWIFDTATRSQIAQNKQTQLAGALAEVLPQEWTDNNLAATRKTIFDINQNLQRTIYTATVNNEHTAAIVSAHAPDGYAGDIELLVGILMDGSITGVRVLQHQETPGLGDDIELRRSDWILDFNGASLTTPVQWDVKRDGGSFDQFTGATITPRAVVHAVRQTLVFFKNNQSDIFRKPHE